MKKGFMIAAPTSGAGKTTVAVGLMALLASKGYKVQPFKCGPDYIDTMFHGAVCARPSVNLDLFMASHEYVRELYRRYSSDADIAVVEGMMGMYDGYERQKGSPADIAMTLGLPVVLVVDASHTGYSIAPLLYGFKNFCGDVKVLGVIYNKVGSERHKKLLREACEEVGLECFGFIPRRKEAMNGERYLGLDFSRKADAGKLADMIEESVDWRGIVERLEGESDKEKILITDDTDDINENKILVARNDEAFSFVYQEHIDILRSRGTVEFFDPEEDREIPLDTALLYLPGGYPEKHLDELYRAERCRRSVREYAERGGRIIAECGGMMYLCESIISDDGEAEMCGVLPYKITSRKADRKLSLGYRRVVIDGKEWRGHEFHYTQFLEPRPQSAAIVYDARGNVVDSPVIRQGNVMASYTHLYWGSQENMSLFV
ncbi:MAG: cobyrinate a,c-diamide synthase [Prevotella sp.]